MSGEAFSPSSRASRVKRLSSLVIKASAPPCRAISPSTSCCTNQEYCQEILYTNFKQILFYILRSFKSKTKVVNSFRTLSPDELCYQIMHYIDTHMYSIKNLSVLSEKFSYNYSYLSNLFKNHTGITLSAYYHSRRLDAATLLIDEKKLKINQIAEILGYSSPYSFSKAFKQKYGSSPKNYTK